MKTQSYKKGWAFVLTLAMVFTTLFGGFGFLGINGMVEEAYADTTQRTTTLDLTSMLATDNVSEGWEWDGASMLTLKGINLSTASPTGIILPTGASIILSGDNHVESIQANGESSYGIYATNGVTISGDGMLIVTAGAVTTEAIGTNPSTGIYSGGTMTINGGTVIASGGNASRIDYSMRVPYSFGIEIESALTINGGTVTASGGTCNGNSGSSYGIWGGHDLNMNGGILNVSGGSVISPEYGISRGLYFNRYIRFNGGTTTITTTDGAPQQIAVYGAGGINFGPGQGISAPVGAGLSTDTHFIRTEPGGTTSAAIATISPTLLDTVSISGQAKVGQTLSATVSPSAAIVTYQWRAEGINIATATGETYTVQASELGKTITVTVTATGGYSGEVTSAPTNAVTDPSITAASITMTAPVAGATPEIVGNVEATTANSDYTVTGVTWNQAMTGGGKFKAGTTYTATIGLTSKNAKEFQLTAFTPTVAGSASVSTTATTGTGTGNTVSFTVTYAPTVSLAVSSISVTTQPTKLTYTETADGVLELNGMIVTATNNDGTTASAIFTDGTAAGYTANPANGSTLTVAGDNGHSVTITHTASSRTTTTGALTLSANTAKAITAFNFNGLTPNIAGTINEAGKTIALTVPYGTDVTALVPTITHTGASVSPNTGVAQNFTIPVTYTVTAADSSAQAYIVTVTVAANTAKAITAFNFNGLTPNIAGTINEAGKTIALTVPYGTDVTAFVPTITHTGASVSPNTGVAQNFTSPVTYTVTAANSSTQAYIVTVTVAANTTYTISADTALINFGSLTTGYGSAPALQTVTITNTGSQIITLTEPAVTNSSSNYTIGLLSDTTLGEGQTATFTLQPKTGLGVGTYNENIQIVGTESAATSVSVQFSVTSSGGSSGGGSGSNSPKATPVIGTSTGRVTGSQLKDAADAAKDGGTVTVKSNETSEVTLPTSGLDSLSGKNNSLTVVTENGTLTFNSKAVDAMGTQATATDIKVIVDDVVKTTLTEDQQTKVGDKTVYDLSVMSGGKLISSFHGGKVNVSIPYELKTVETAENLTVWYMADNGSLTEINCTYDTKTKSVVFVVDHFSKYIIGYDDLADWANPFTDVKSSAWYYDAAAFVNVNGLMKGQTDTTFGPQAAMTRGMFVTILGRMEGVDTSVYTNKNTFSDVKSNQYDTPYIAWASEKGIVTGMGEDKFAPNAAVTREQMSVMMTNYMKFKDQGPKGEWAIQLTYGDLEKVSSWADEGVMFMTMKDLMNGMGNDTKGNPLFAPKLTSTRAQTAQVMMNLEELLK